MTKIKVYINSEKHLRIGQEVNVGLNEFFMLWSNPDTMFAQSRTDNWVNDGGRYAVELSLTNDFIVDLLNWVKCGGNCNKIMGTVVENLTPTHLEE